MHAVVDLPPDEARAFGARPVLGRHALDAHPLFSDEGLAELLDRWPRPHLYALATGEDPARLEDNALAVHDGVSGADLLAAVRKGRLWLNATHADEADPRLRDLVAMLYGELAARVPGFRPIEAHGTLLISSPRAVVYFHVDGPPSVLWHVRGRKRLWLYPERFVARAHLEDVFAGAAHEYAPWTPAYDEEAVVVDLEPGAFATWPQNAPHRVTNGDDVCVSLSTDHYTPESKRKARVWRANRWLRSLGYRASTREDGLRARAKVLLQRLLDRERPTTKRHVPRYRVDPSAPGGVVPIC